MSIFESFGPKKFKSVEELEKEQAERMKPMDEETFNQTAEKLEKKARKEGLEAVGQLPPEPFPVEGEQERKAA